MGKYYGNVGFATQKKTDPGVYEAVVIERPYSGEILDNRWRTSPGANLNTDIVLSCDFSILCDPYILKNHAYIAYVTYMGVKWAISNAVVNYPRIILTAGGVYNENEDRSSEFPGENDGE